MSAPEFRLLFVCMGNICRSPAAEGVMTKLAGKAGLIGRLQVDSAGTGGWHAGEPPDARMITSAARRGYELTGRARQVLASDFQRFDLIVVMDAQNLRDLKPFDPGGGLWSKVRMFCEFCSQHDDEEVPDPYYGGEAGFQRVIDLIEDGCAGLLDHAREHLARRPAQP